MKLFGKKPIPREERNKILALKVAFLLVILGFILFQASIPMIEIDDAYITFRYARNFANGKGLVFNIGERVEGYSNFLWVILLSVGSRMGCDIAIFAKWVGVLFTLLSSFFCILILRRDKARPTVYFWGDTFVLSILVFSYPSILYWASGALETPLIMFSLIFAIWIVTLEGESVLVSLIKGIAMALPSLVRFDGIIFSAIMIVYLLVNFKKAPFTGRIILQILISVAVVGIYHVWRIGYYDSFFPNTVIVKGSTGFWRLFRGGISYMIAFITVNNILLFFVPIFFVLILRLKFSKTDQLLFLFIISYWIFIALIRGDFMAGHRYATATIPPLVLLGVLSGRKLLKNSSLNSIRYVHIWILLFVFTIAITHFLGYYVRDFHKRYEWPAEKGKHYRLIVNYLIERNLGYTSLAIDEPGIPGYFFPGIIIDTWGLTDRTIALIKKRHKIPITSIKFGNDAVPENRGNAKKEIAEYILSQRPTAIYGLTYGLSKDRLEKLGYKEVKIKKVPYPLLINFSKQDR